MSKKVSYTASYWKRRAEARIQLMIEAIQTFPELKKKGPSAVWKIDFSWVGRKTMAEMNSKYRGKSYPTDILSFPTAGPFLMMGILGELVICGPVLNAQAKQLKHSAQKELDVLLVHGILHLLGFDHEMGDKEAKVMALWESKVLQKLDSKKGPSKRSLRGLIDRSNSGIES